MENKNEYLYLDREPIAGDVVECVINHTNEFTKGKLYKCTKFMNNLVWVDIDDKGSRTNGLHVNNFRVVKTKAGSEAKVGDTCIVHTSNDAAINIKVGDLVTLHEKGYHNDFRCYDGGASWIEINHLTIICKKESNKSSNIDLRNTWCKANVPNHDKLRYLGYDHEPIGCCKDFYIIDYDNEIFDSNIIDYEKYKQIELDENNNFVYVEKEEEFIDESSLNIIEKEPNEENSFTKYGFEVPTDFEGEILKKVGSWLIGYVKNGNQAPMPCMWFEHDGSSSLVSYNLSPIKKPWYETCKFPCLITSDNYGCVWVHYYNNGYVYDYRDSKYCVKLWKLLSNDEIEILKQ